MAAASGGAGLDKSAAPNAIVIAVLSMRGSASEAAA